MISVVDFDEMHIRGVWFSMKKKSVFFRVAALLLLSLIISSLAAFSALAATADRAYSDDVLLSSPVIQMGWGSGSNDDSPEPSDTGSGVELLLIILVSMSIVAFGALAFKLFSDRITKKELVILLLVLIFVVVAVLLALYINFVGKSGDGLIAASAFIEKNIFVEGNNL